MIVSREHTLRFSWHEHDGGRVIAYKNDHLGMLIEMKRRAMATMIITQCFKSYNFNAYDEDGETLAYTTVLYE